MGYLIVVWPFRALVSPQILHASMYACSHLIAPQLNTICFTSSLYFLKVVDGKAAVCFTALRQVLQYISVINTEHLMLCKFSFAEKSLFWYAGIYDD